jgi:hypothetical protein
MECYPHEIDSHKSLFKTFQDVQNHFNRMNQDYERFQEDEIKRKNSPNIIY